MPGAGSKMMDNSCSSATHRLPEAEEYVKTVS